jgi:hypothetical protein
MTRSARSGFHLPLIFCGHRSLLLPTDPSSSRTSQTLLLLFHPPGHAVFRSPPLSFGLLRRRCRPWLSLIFLLDWSTRVPVLVYGFVYHPSSRRLLFWIHVCLLEFFSCLQFEFRTARPGARCEPNKPTRFSFARSGFSSSTDPVRFIHRSCS